MNPLNRHETYTQEHYEYCTSTRQKEFLELVLQKLPIADIAERMGIHQRNVLMLGQRIRKNAKRYGYDANATDKGNMPTPGQVLPVKGTSTLYKTDAETGITTPALSWVKTNKTAEEMIADAKEVIAAMGEEIQPVKHVTLPVNYSELCGSGTSASHLMNVHVVTDYHLGMLSWGEECGEDWDTDIAESMFTKWMHASIQQAPIARRGVLLQLGDFLHFDGMLPVTPASGHILDSDTRYAKVIRVAIRSLRRVVAMMLLKYPEVDLIMAEGNHDPSASIWLRELLAALYSEEPRINVVTDPSPFGALQHGKCMVGYHHGHKKRIGDLDRVLAGKFSKMFGECEYRYAHVGHFHHKAMSESQLMIVEQHATMAAHDAYAANGGYMSQRSAEVITYHDSYGEVARQRMTPRIIEDI